MNKFFALAFACFVLTSLQPARAQNIPLNAHNSVFLEVLGNGLIYSINYDYRPQDFFSIRAGVSFFSATDGTGTTNSIFALPVLANYLFNFGASNIVLGLGPTYLSAGVSSGGESSTGSAVELVGRLGYLLQPKDGGFVFGACWTPYLAGKFTQMAWGGIDLGYAF